MNKVRIYHAVGRDHRFSEARDALDDGRGGRVRFRYEKVFEGDLDVSGPEHLYRMCQNDFGMVPYKGRSLSVGDVVVIDGEVFEVAGMGFNRGDVPMLSAFALADADRRDEAEKV